MIPYSLTRGAKGQQNRSDPKREQSQSQPWDTAQASTIFGFDNALIAAAIINLIREDE